MRNEAKLRRDSEDSSSCAFFGFRGPFFGDDGRKDPELFQFFDEQERFTSAAGLLCRQTS